MTKVKFLKAWRSYNAGEHAAFDEHSAKAMVDKKVVVIVPERDDPAPASKPFKTVPRNVVIKDE